MTQALFYSSNAVSMTLSAPIASGDTACTLSSTAGLPASFPFKLLVDWGNPTQEVVHVTGLSGSVATISRAQDGTTAQSHSVGAPVVHGVSAREFNDLEAHIPASTNVHGLTGGAAVVGDTSTQTLTNKTLTAPVIAQISNGGTITLPTSTDTLVGRATADTLTNKTLTAPAINSGVLDGASTIGGVSGTALSVLGSAWTSYTPTFTNCTSPTGVFKYLQIGKTLLIRGYFTGGTATATAQVGVSLPNSLTIDSTFQPLASDSASLGGWFVSLTRALTRSNVTAGASLLTANFAGVIEVQ